MTRPPVSLAGHVSFIHNGHAVSTGGVNENIFNGYFSDVELSKGEFRADRESQQGLF